VDLLPSAGTELQAGDFVTLDVEGDVILTASEPAPAVLLLAAGFALTFVHRRRRFRA
jgi:MYXO-CTERM domain-containing protein